MAELINQVEWFTLLYKITINQIMYDYVGVREVCISLIANDNGDDRIVKERNDDIN